MADNYDDPGDYERVIAVGASVERAHVIYDAVRTLIFEKAGTLTMADLDNSGNHIIVENYQRERCGYH